MRYHLLPIRMAIIKKSTNNKGWRGCGGKGTLLHCWNVNWYRHCGKQSQNEKQNCRMIQQSHSPEYIWKKTITEKDPCTSMFIAALFVIAKIWKQLKCPSADEWIKNMHKEHIYIMEYYSAIKKNAAAAAKLLQSCPTLCDPIDGSPPGSHIPGILQARTLECMKQCHLQQHGPGDYLIKWSKSQRERQIPYSTYHLYVKSKIPHKWMYLQTETDSQT